ncbi:MAG: FHA domain-containing protein [Fimbriimonadales bacterium]|nr:FHA domain-containing protein [Fimbriimonadales bacterium]
MTDPHKTQSLPTDPNRTVMTPGPTFEATVTIKPIQCPVCKTFNPAGVMFCVDCGLIFDRALPEDAFGAPKVQLPCLVDSTGREHAIRPGRNAVGREGDIVLPDPRVSRRHAAIILEEGRVTLEDLGSTNGTTVNGQPLPPGQQRELQPGDKVAFGGVETAISFPGQAGATQQPPSRQTVALEAPPVAEAAASEPSPSEPPAPAYLVGDGLRLPLKPGPNSFGRKAENDLRLPDPYVSGRHGLLEVDEEGVWVTDLGSTNGTFVNGERVEPNQRLRLSDGDLLKVGGLELRIEVR